MEVGAAISVSPSAGTLPVLERIPHPSLILGPSIVSFSNSLRREVIFVWDEPGNEACSCRHKYCKELNL